VALARLVCGAGTDETALSRERLEEQLESGRFFWLDLHQPDRAELELLGDTFGFHPLALEDSLHLGQRPKLEEYDGFVFLVVYGWAPDADGLAEVHCYYSDRYLVTVHRDEAPALAEAQPLCERSVARGEDGIVVLHHVIDSLVDSFFPVVERFDTRLELIEDELLARPSERHVEDILAMRRRLVTLRRVVAAQRDLFGRLLGGVAELPGMNPEAERYFRDVYDHLFRLAELIDGLRDLMTGAIDVYLSSSANRLGSVTKQLTVIATIFLPLTFVAGFFGQNFEWMVDHTSSGVAFLVFGIGIQLLTIAALVAYFKRQGWF
jgi:magnesium transporter